jgi:hypothetical protein
LPKVEYLLKNNPPLVAIELSKQLIKRQKVKMQQQITKGFDYFLKQNELGKTDSKNINRLLQMMDENGHRLIK